MAATLTVAEMMMFPNQWVESEFMKCWVVTDKSVTESIVGQILGDPALFSKLPLSDNRDQISVCFNQEDAHVEYRRRSLISQVQTELMVMASKAADRVESIRQARMLELALAALVGVPEAVDTMKKQDLRG